MTGTWQDSWESQEAIRRLGGVQEALADPVTFLEMLGQVIEEAGALRAYLGERGYTLGQVTDLMAEVADLRDAADVTNKGNGEDPNDSRIREIVRELWCRGFDSDQICRMLQLPSEQIAGCRVTKIDPKAREVVRLHAQGLTVYQIAERLDVHRWSVMKHLRRAGLTPNASSDNRAGAALRARIVSLRADGADYPTIRAKTGASTNQIRNALRRAREKGLLEASA
ncbi:MAG TPA: hypothetical protein VE990_12385 [Acidimicrobiales bacterium]|nr:hypothetical protein [Acidimicrobiales bacterium]